LTFRETQIVELVARGKANKEIAYQLLLSEGTIKEYLNRIFRKLEVPNRTALAIWEFTRKAAAAGENGYDTSAAFEKHPIVA
jgi:DNA-binding NarL/FixJ family response regulator